MKTVIHRSINDVPAVDWNSLAGPLICRHEYLSAVEASDINGCRYFYPAIYDNDRLVAHTCVYAIGTELDTFAQGPLKHAIQGMRRWRPDFLVLRSLECGTPVALGSTISIAPDHDPQPIMAMLISAVEHVSAELGIRVVLWRDFIDNDHPCCAALRAHGYRHLQNLPGARLQVRWPSFAEYLDNMRSQYRTKLLAQQRRFHADGQAHIECLYDFAPLAETLAALWQNVYDHAREYRRERLKADFFRNISTKLAGRSAVLLARYRQTPIGFLLLFLDEHELIPIFAGLDYEYSRDRGTYFNLFYEAVRMAIERHYQHVDLGITTIEPKLDLGGILTPLHMYMKYRGNALLHRIVPSLFAAMTPQPKVTSRHVFRETRPS